jgi:hypothetical protein
LNGAFGIIMGAFEAMPLPNFLIVGAAKCGTTSLYEYLRQHPDVYMSPLKEPRYFPSFGVLQGDPVVRDRAEYEQLFDGAKTERAIGEASPQYLHAPEAAERIAAELPDARIIVSLRNPADRAYSSYLSRVGRGVERRPVQDALQPGNYYFDASLYGDALARYFAVFGRSRVKVLLFDDFARDTAAALRDLCAFLDIAANVAIDTDARHNVGFVPKWAAVDRIVLHAATAAAGLLPMSMRGTGLAFRLRRLWLRRPPPLPTELRVSLLRAFEPDIGRTGKLIGRDLSGWK